MHQQQKFAMGGVSDTCSFRGLCKPVRKQSQIWRFPFFLTITVFRCLPTFLSAVSDSDATQIFIRCVKATFESQFTHNRPHLATENDTIYDRAKGYHRPNAECETPKAIQKPHYFWANLTLPGGLRNLIWQAVL